WTGSITSRILCSTSVIGSCPTGIDAAFVRAAARERDLRSAIGETRKFVGRVDVAKARELVEIDRGPGQRCIPAADSRLARSEEGRDPGCKRTMRQQEHRLVTTTAAGHAQRHASGGDGIGHAAGEVA